MAKRNLKITKKAAKLNAAKTKPVEMIDQGVQKHSMASTTAQDGKSPVTNSRKSTTRIQIEKFGTLTHASMTVRDDVALSGLRKAYGGKAFERGNMDAGILRRLGERGHIEYIDGNPASASAKFKLSKSAI